MQEGREGAWLLLRAESWEAARRGPCGRPASPLPTLTCLLPHSTIQARVASSYLENSSRVLFLYEWASIHTINV